MTRTVLLLLALVCGSATVQGYPVKPVRLVVPYAVGGGSDVIGRLFAQRIGEVLAQNMVVDNRAGANGMIGAEYWYGIVGPAAQPRPDVDKLDAAIAGAVAQADVRDRMTGVAVEPAARTPEQFRGRIESDFARWARLARDANLGPPD